MVNTLRPPRSAFGLFLLAAAMGLLGASPDAAPTPNSTLNEKVVAFARSHLGKKVGNGDCIALAVAALTEAGARLDPLERGDGDYVWGRLVEAPKDARPGDILQFRDAVFKGKQRYSGGRWISWHQQYPHHTAILGEVKLGGKVLTILHQNIGGKGVDEDRKRTVQEATLRMDSLQKGGWVRIYRPIPRAEDDPADAPPDGEGWP